MSLKWKVITTDGTMFDDEASAKKHQADVDLWEKVLEKYGVYGELKISYLCDFLDVLNFIKENNYESE